jgi:Tol biopolymer transport system component
MSDSQQRQHFDDVLEGWKAIAGHLNRDVRTAKRWEVSEGLPVHRHMHNARSSVYAYRGELDAWRANRRPEPHTDKGDRRRARRLLAVAATMLLAVLTAGGGTVRSAVGADGPAITARQVWTGDGADRFGSVSRDGRYLSYMDPETGDLAIYDVRAGTRRRITSNGSGFKEFAEYSVFSPDGRKLAYGWQNAEGEYELRLIARDGGGPQVLVPKAPWLRPYGFSPDSVSVLVLIGSQDRKRQLALVSALDGSIRIVKTLAGKEGVPNRAEYSPDGRYIAFDRRSDAGHSDVFLIPSRGGEESALVDGTANETLLGWFPNGESLLFASDRLGSASAWAVAVNNGKPVGEPRLLKPDLGRVVPKGFTRSGTFFYHLTIGIADVVIAAIDPITGNSTQPAVPLRGKSASPRIGATWSPDGSRIAYRVNQSMTIGIHDVASGAVQTLPLSLAYAEGLPGVWSPDGRALIMAGRDHQGEHGIYRIDIASGELSSLTTTGPGLIGAVALSRDGKHLYYRRANTQSAAAPGTALYVHDLATKEEREIFKPAHGTVGAFLLSPDNRTIALRLQNTDGTRSLQLVPSTGGTPRSILRDKVAEIVWGGFAWTANGDGLLLVRGGSLSHIATVDGTLRKMDVDVRGMNRISLHPDGRQLAIGSVDTKEEIWALENLAAKLRTN